MLSFRDRNRIENLRLVVPGWGYLIYTDKTLLRVEPGSKFVYHPNSLDLIIGGIWYRAEKQGQQFRIYTPYSSGAPKGTTFSVDVAPDGTSRLYVYDGHVAFSDTDTKKTVTIGAGQNATCSKGGVPSEPKHFEPGSVDMWWERGPPYQPVMHRPVPTKKSAGFASAVAIIACAGACMLLIRRR